MTPRTVLVSALALMAGLGSPPLAETNPLRDANFAICHNANLSDGRIDPTEVDLNGRPIDRVYA